MILEYRIDETTVKTAWLQTLYDLAEELNCKCQTFFEEGYSASKRCFAQTRIVKIIGANAMISWFKLRMERYNHFVNNLNEYAEIVTNEDEKTA